MTRHPQRRVQRRLQHLFLAWSVVAVTACTSPAPPVVLSPDSLVFEPPVECGRVTIAKTTGQLVVEEARPPFLFFFISLALALLGMLYNCILAARTSEGFSRFVYVLFIGGLAFLVYFMVISLDETVNRRAVVDLTERTLAHQEESPIRARSTTLALEATTLRLVRIPTGWAEPPELIELQLQSRQSTVVLFQASTDEITRASLELLRDELGRKLHVDVDPLVGERSWWLSALGLGEQTVAEAVPRSGGLAFMRCWVQCDPAAQSSASSLFRQHQPLLYPSR